MEMNKEIRAFSFDIRAQQNEQHGHFITGTPIVFGQETDVGWCREIIERGALDKCDLRDVRFLVNHNTDMIPLARSRNNNENSTMQFSVGDHGMDIRVDLDTDNNSDSRSLYSATDRGDISGMSFMFVVDDEEWEDITSDKPLRRIRSIAKVFEVSAVTWPAYEQTSLEARGLANALESGRAMLESMRAKAREESEARDRKVKTLKLMLEVNS